MSRRRGPGRLSLEPLDQQTWHDVAASSPAASFFHFPAWAGVARAQYPHGEPLALGTELADGARLAIPLFRPAGDVLGGPVLSTFAGCYGGPVASRALRPDERDAALAALSRARFAGPLLVTLPPAAVTAAGSAGGVSAASAAPGAAAPGAAAPGAAAPGAAAPGAAAAGQSTAAVPGSLGPRVRRHFRMEEDFTHIVALAGRAPREILGGLQQAKRRQYRKGVELGVRMRAGARPDVERYLEIYGEATRRRGERASSSYPAGVYQELGRLSEEQPSRVRLWLLEQEGEAVAGAWVLEAGGRAVLWDAAARDVGSAQFSPVASLYVELLLEAAGRGLTGFDLGPSGGHASASELKRRLGAERRPVLRLRRDPPRWLRLQRRVAGGR